MFLFVISGFCLLFGWMLFLAESLSSLRKYFFLVGIHCSVYIINSLLAANSMCSWEPHLLDCKPWLIKVFHHFMRFTIRTAYIFYFLTLSKGIGDAQSFLGYVLPTRVSFRIRFSCTSVTGGIWWTEASCGSGSIIDTRVGNYMGNARIRERRERISEA